MIIYKDNKYGFFEIFNEKNGTLVRSDIKGKEPTCRSFPELLDVGIMGHCDSSVYCRKAGVDCYQKGYLVETPHMTVEQFESIARQATGKTFQIALGGAGDPNKHPHFSKILEICNYYKIIPNLTTSGFDITDTEIDSIANGCGAVAVSWYSRLINGIESNDETVKTIDKLLYAGCTTNIHYVISRQTIDEAIHRLKYDIFPKGIDAVVFILYKPVGFGIKENIIDDIIKLEQFLLLASNKHPYRIGFDTCFTPAILEYCSDKIPLNCIDACEAGTFSMYIDSQMNAFPCSFGIDNKSVGLSLNDYSIRDIWNSKVFTDFRQNTNTVCTLCSNKNNCLGGCRLQLDINLCKRCNEKERK